MSPPASEGTISTGITGYQGPTRITGCRGPVDFGAIEPIEHLFLTSRVMASVRFVELSPEACAVVYSDHGRIRWMKPSRTFPHFLKKGTEVPHGTIASAFYATSAICELPRMQPATLWLGAHPRIGVAAQLMEHSAVISGSGWGGILSLLWIPHCSGALRVSSSASSHAG